eukprot:GHUV01011082.1.p1 GENE.GHUV01011082.1~~GHUV01011082.1.p1  ORF type:complete len:1183 (+),score=437.55 GHUV01011082.1:626-4174(+)
MTVSPLSPDYLPRHFPAVTSLDLSRYQRSCQEVFPVMQNMRLRSLVLADPLDRPASIPTQYLLQLTHLSFLAEGLLMDGIAAQFCQALRQLTLLQELHLNRLQLSTQAAQQLAQVFIGLPNLQALALSGGAAVVRPEELYMLFSVDLPQLRSLELTRLGIRTLPPSLTRLVGLTRLTFGGEMLRIVQLTDELRHLTNLQVLDISANLSEQLPDGVLELTSLRELHAGMNRIGVHMHSLTKLEQLEVMVLASNKLVAVHPSLWSLTGLKRLDLGHNNLSDLPANVSQLTQVTYLNVCHNFLTSLTSGLSCLVKLVELDVSLNTDMRELPAGLGQMAKLTRLTASHMRLKQLPADVGGLVSLVHLDVSHNSLHHLAPQLSSLLSLTHLEASDNKLHQSAAVPEELSTLTALKVLRLARNRLQSLPEALGCYASLQILDCSGNRLTSVPRVVGKCTALQQLLMASNRLRGLTSGIGNLLRLQVLDLSHNQYRHLPTMTGDLTQLQELLLEDNQLEDLPNSCSTLIKLNKLTLSNNRLHVLPPAISRMSGLVTLTLRANPLLDRDAVVLQLQRQLPLLQLDGLPALGINKPIPAFGQEALQLISSWPADNAAALAAPGQGATAIAAVSNPPQIAIAAGAGPSWLLQQDLSHSLAQFIQQAVQQSQGEPAAQQQPGRNLMGLMIGDTGAQGLGRPAQAPTAGLAGSGSPLPTAGSSAVYPAAWLGSQVPAAAGSGTGPFSWQHMLSMQPAASHPVLQQASQASSSSNSSMQQQRQQQSASVQQLPDWLQTALVGDVQAQPTSAGLPAGGVGYNNILSNAVPAARSVSQMRSLAGTYMPSDGSGSSDGACAGSSGGTAGQMHAAPGPSSSNGAPSSSSSFVARVKSYLEVATSATSAAASRNWQAVSSQQQQPSRSGGLHRSASDDPQRHLFGPLSSDMLQLHGQADSLPRSRSAVGALSIPAAAATVSMVPHPDTPEAGGSAAATGQEHATDNSTSGGAAPSERDVDDACSAGGVESCGSEDSGSEVLVRLGNLSNAGADLGSSTAAGAHDLMPVSYTCSPLHVREVAGQCTHGVEVSRCPSSTSSVAGTAGGSLGLGLPGASAAAAEGDAAADSDGCSQLSEGGAGSAKGARSATSQQSSRQQQPSGAHATSSVAGAGSSQASGQGDGDRSFTTVLDSAWWGRRRK